MVFLPTDNPNYVAHDVFKDLTKVGHSPSFIIINIREDGLFRVLLSEHIYKINYKKLNSCTKNLYAFLISIDMDICGKAFS